MDGSKTIGEDQERERDKNIITKSQYKILFHTNVTPS